MRVHVRIVVAAFFALGAAQASPALTEAERNAPCVRLVTAQELKSLGRADVLTRVSHDQAGSSICGWEAPSDGSKGFTVALQTAEWFKSEQVAGAVESFNLKRYGYDQTIGTDPVTGLGLEARITRHKPMPTVMIRRAADVVYVMCIDCSREQTIAIARLAIAP